MKELLELITSATAKGLSDALGYCGVMTCENEAILNTSVGGKDYIITITIKELDS